MDVLRECRFEHAALGNGLTVIGEVMPWSSSAAIGVFVRVGARDEEPRHSGISHFLEHMVFRGDRSRCADDVALAFRSMRACPRGFAAEECTAYYAFVPADCQSRLLRLWADLMEPAIRPDDVEDEKRVILEELRDREDEPSLLVADAARRLHFGEHACGRSMLGAEDAVGHMYSRSIREHYDRWYAPSNTVLACTGNIDWCAFVEDAEALFGGWRERAVPRRDAGECSGTGTAGHFSREGVTRSHACFVTAAPSAQSPLSHASWVLADMLGGGILSRLHGALISCELADKVESKYDALDGTGAYYTYVSGHPRRAGQVVDVVLRNYASIRAGDISEHALQAGRRRLVGQIRRSCKMAQSRLVPMALGWLYRKRYLPPSDEINAVQALRRRDIIDLVRDYPLEPVTLATLGPV